MPLALQHTMRWALASLSNTSVVASLIALCSFSRKLRASTLDAQLCKFTTLCKQCGVTMHAKCLLSRGRLLLEHGVVI